MFKYQQLLAFSIAAVGLCARLVDGQIMGPTDTMTISNINANPDGLVGVGRSVIGVNGQHPAPLIKANKGDNFNINVVNDLSDSTMLRQTSVHWHGVFQHGSAWADGPEGVTQCPISQFGQAFRYTFSAGQETGTYWYHSHFGTQYCDGLRGPIVIYDDNDPHRALYEVDDENTVITLADWYHVPAPTLGNGPALSNSTLINGKGRLPNGPASDIAIVNVQEGRKYRMRLISMSCDPDYTFSIDGHDLTIIEADGQLTEQHTVQQLRIFAGQRYSFVLHANNVPGNYWIRAKPNLGFGQLTQFDEGGVNSAILRYAGVDPVNPTSQRHSSPTILRESDLRALVNPVAPGGEIEQIPISFGFSGGAWRINGAAWGHPESPVMVQVMSGRPPSEILPEGAIRILPKDKTIELVISGSSGGGPHPFHMHGHAFSVVKSADSSVSNAANPVRRDVVSTGLTGNTTIIRFRTDNPGPWFFHCHIEFHLTGGLGMVFLEAPEDIPLRPPPTPWGELCPTYSQLPAEATSISTVRTVPTVAPV